MTQPSRVALVTGGARGIGAAIAERLAADGCDIAVMDLDPAACADTVARIEALGRRAIAVAVDVANEASVQFAVEARGQFDSVCTWLLLNADDDGRFAAAGAFASLQCAAFTYVRDVANQYWPSATDGDEALTDFAWRAHATDGL